MPLADRPSGQLATFTNDSIAGDVMWVCYLTTCAAIPCDRHWLKGVEPHHGRFGAADEQLLVDMAVVTSWSLVWLKTSHVCAETNRI